MGSNKRIENIIVLIGIIILASSLYVRAETNISITGGFPRGFMTYSGNVTFSHGFRDIKMIRPELAIEESYSFRKFPGNGTATLAVTSLYFLGQYELTPFGKIHLFAKSGSGLHFVWSHSSSESPFGKKNLTKLETKVHLIPGIKNVLSNHLNLIAYFRLTIPSHLILDSYYLGMQFNL